MPTFNAKIKTLLSLVLLKNLTCVWLVSCFHGWLFFTFIHCWVHFIIGFHLFYYQVHSFLDIIYLLCWHIFWETEFHLSFINIGIRYVSFIIIYLVREIFSMRIWNFKKVPQIKCLIAFLILFWFWSTASKKSFKNTDLFGQKSQKY